MSWTFKEARALVASQEMLLIDVPSKAAQNDIRKAVQCYSIVSTCDTSAETTAIYAQYAHPGALHTLPV